MTRSTAAAAVLAVAGLAVSGCGGGSASTGSGASTPIKASDVNPQPRSALKQGGVLRWALDEFPSQYNVNQVDGADQEAVLVENAILPRLYHYDDKGVVTPDPDFLTSASVTATTPKQVVTYELNRKAHWSDGKPIIWKDYAAQWKAVRSASGPYLVASATGYERIGSVEEGRNPYEVIVTYDKPFGDWRSLFDPLYPASANSTPKAFNTAYATAIPITAGPFKLGKIDKTAKEITIVRDPKWWGRPALLDTIIFRAMSDDAIVNSFANGEVDTGDVGPDPSAFKRALGVSGGAVREAGGPDFRQITINGTSPDLTDVKVRQAIAMGINRDVIARADLTGLNWPAKTMDNHFLVNTQTGYQNNAAAIGAYNPTAAAKLLDADGWKLSGAYRSKGGKTLALRFVIPEGFEVSKQEAELVLPMLKQIGVKLIIAAVPTDDLFTKYIIPGNFDLAPFAYIGTPFAISSSQSIYVNPTKNAKGQIMVQQNLARVGSPEIDATMAKAEAQLDPVKATVTINQADKLIWNEVHSLILYQRPQITAVKADIGNLGSFGFESVAYQDIGFMK